MNGSILPCLSVFPACAALLAAATAVGGTVYWNMDDLAAPTSTTVTNLTVSSITQGNTTTIGGTTSSPSSGYSFALNETSTLASGSTNLIFSARAGALSSASSSFMTVTLTPSVGSTGTVRAIGFGSRSTASGPTTLSLRASHDSYATDVAGFSTSTNSAWSYFTNTFTVPLAIASGSSLTLRLYGAGGSSVSAGNWRLDDLQFDVVVVPEPAALVLGLAGAAGAVIAGRRSSHLARGTTKRCAEPNQASASSNCSS